MKGTIGLHQRWGAIAKHFLKSFFSSIGWYFRIDSIDCSLQPAFQYHRPKGFSFSSRLTGRNRSAIGIDVAKLFKPFNGGLFDMGFVDYHAPPFFPSFGSLADKSCGAINPNCRPFFRWMRRPFFANSNRSVLAV